MVLNCFEKLAILTDNVDMFIFAPRRDSPYG